MIFTPGEVLFENVHGKAIIAEVRDGNCKVDWYEDGKKTLIHAGFNIRHFNKLAKAVPYDQLIQKIWIGIAQEVERNQHKLKANKNGVAVDAAAAQAQRKLVDAVVEFKSAVRALIASLPGADDMAFVEDNVAQGAPVPWLEQLAKVESFFNPDGDAQPIESPLSRLEGFLRSRGAAFGAVPLHDGTWDLTVYVQDGADSEPRVIGEAAGHSIDHAIAEALKAMGRDVN